MVIFISVIIINVELNCAWIPEQHHRNVAGREGMECASKHQTNSIILDSCALQLPLYTSVVSLHWW